MQPTIKELEEKYNKMRDDEILNLVEDEEGMRPEAIKLLKKIIKKRGIHQKIEVNFQQVEKIKINRIGRMEFFKITIKTLGIILVILLLIGITPWSFLHQIIQFIFSVIYLIIGFYCLYIAIVAQIKRQHDVGLNWWFLLITFLPYIGWIFYLFLFFKKGDSLENKYGPAPAIKL